VNAEVGTDIEQIIDDARTQYICGQIDDEGLEAAAAQWLNRGGDRLIEEINQLYQPHLSEFQVSLLYRPFPHLTILSF